MDSKGQQGIGEGIIALLVVMLVIAAISPLLGLLTANFSQPYEKRINTLESELEKTKNELNVANSEKAFWINEYENLKNTEITKEDFIEIKKDLNYVIANIENNNTNYYNLRNEFIEMQYIQNTYFILAISVAIELALFSFLLIDFVFFSFGITRKIVTKIKFWKKETKIEINQKE